MPIRRLPIAAFVSLAALTPLARSQFTVIDPTASNPLAPLQRIVVGDDLSFQIKHINHPGNGQFYPTGSIGTADMGFFVKSGGSLVAPDFSNLTIHTSGSATAALGPRTAWLPVLQSPVTGTGTTLDPYTMYVDASSSVGLRARLTVKYRDVDDFVRHDLTLVNVSGAPITFDTFVGSDLYLAGSDAGIAFQIGAGVGGKDCGSGGYHVQHVPFTPASRKTGNRYSTVWSQIGAGTLDNALAPGCIDNGAALEWGDRTLGPGQQLTILSATCFGDCSGTQYISGVNKDIRNNTGSIANGVDILLEGTWTTLDLQGTYNGPFPSFVLVPSGTNTILRWFGATVLPGELRHVGYSVWAQSSTILGVFWTFNGNAVGCATQCNIGRGTHASGIVRYINSATSCSSIPIYVGNLRAEYYVAIPPLADWNSTSMRSPIQTIALPGVHQVQPGGFAEQTIPIPPIDALYVLLLFTVSENPTLSGLDTTDDFLLVPVVELNQLVGGNYCSPSVPNSTGSRGVMTAIGSADVGSNDLTLHADGLATHAFGYFLLSRTQGFIPSPGTSMGNLCIAGAIGRFVGPGQVLNSGASGRFSLPVDLTQLPQPTGFVPAQPGDSWNFTAWYRDSFGGSSTSNFADGLTITFM